MPERENENIHDTDEPSEPEPQGDEGGNPPPQTPPTEPPPPGEGIGPGRSGG